MSNFPLTDKQIFQKVLSESVKNIIFFGIAVAVIILIGRLYWWAGIVLAAIYIVIAGIDLLRVMLVSIMAIVMIPVNIFQRIKGEEAYSEEKYLIPAQIIQIIETLVSLLYLYLLYLAFFS